MRNLIRVLVQDNLNYQDILQEHLWEEFQKEFRAMYDEGIIALDASMESGYPFKIMPEQVDIKDVDVNKYRKLWSYAKTGVRGYMGEQKEVLKLLKDYWFKYPTHTYEEICTAAKLYVEAQVQSDVKYLMTAENFIYREGKSKLAAWVEDNEKKTNKVKWI
jgi:hypothetical protein